MQQKRIAVLKTCALGLCALGLSSGAWAKPRARAIPDNLLVVPGQRIGRVFIGDTPAAVRRRLGKPSRAFDLGENTSSELWRSGSYTLEVVYEDGEVIQIEATNPAFKMAGGVSRNNVVGDWEELLDFNSDVSFYRYPNKARQEYWDWKSRGLTLETTYPSSKNSDPVRILTVIVHRKREPVITDQGGTSIR